MWLVGALACVSSGTSDEGLSGTADTGRSGLTDGGLDSGTPPDPEVPTDDLDAWLDTLAYRAWPAEPAPHPSTGPHFGQVRTFMSPGLAASLEAGNDRHPEGSATVKELFGDGSEVLGHAVMVRVGPGATDNAWYWYEVYQGQTFADDRGVALCSNCHAAGTDFVLTPWPPTESQP